MTITSQVYKFFTKHKTRIIFFSLLAVFIFLRFYELQERTQVAWDQADSAWAAKSILTEQPFRLEGVPIKVNAGMVMGPLYYYLVTPFYALTDLDIIASSLFAGVVSVLGFFIFYYITKKLFDTKVALFALALYTVSMAVIRPDRVQAAYILIPTLSYIVFYCLYNVLKGSQKHILYLAAAVGFGFHIHFTTIVYPIIILLTLPLFPRTQKTLLYLLLGLGIFLLFISPILYMLFIKPDSNSGAFTSYFETTFHGLHLRRVFQIAHDAFITYEGILMFKIFRPFVFSILPLFTVVYYYSCRKKERLLLPFLMALWIVIPWILLSTYNGELTDYYFSQSRNSALANLAFLTVFLYTRKQAVLKLVVIGFWSFYALYNLNLFFRWPYEGNYLTIKTKAEKAIQNREIVKFGDRDPLYYLYTVYKERQ